MSFRECFQNKQRTKGCCLLGQQLGVGREGLFNQQKIPVQAQLVDDWLLLPRNLTMEPENHLLEKESTIFQTSIFGFHVGEKGVLKQMFFFQILFFSAEMLQDFDSRKKAYQPTMTNTQVQDQDCLGLESVLENFGKFGKKGNHGSCKIPKIHHHFHSSTKFSPPFFSLTQTPVFSHVKMTI